MRQTNHQLRSILMLLFLQLPGLSSSPFPLLASSSETPFQVYLVDDRTGQPVEGAHVGLAGMSESRSISESPGKPIESVSSLSDNVAMWMQLNRPGGPIILVSALNAEPLGGGVYRFENVEEINDNVENGKFIVRVIAEGYAYELLPVVVQGPGVQREVIRLKRPGFVRGLVVDSQGNPVADADVAIAYTDEEFLSIQRQMSSGGGGPISATTNEFGEYFVEEKSGLRPGWSFAVEVSHKDYLPVLSGEALVGEGQVTTINVVLAERANKVEGRVLNEEGEPVKGASVFLQTVEKRLEKLTLKLSSGRKIPFNDPLFERVATLLWMRYYYMHAKSGAGGAFSIPGMPSGRFKIRVVPPEGYETYRDQVEVTKDGNNFFELVLTPKTAD